MSNKEAIKYLQQLYPNGGHCWLDEQRIEAIGMAINALQEEPVSIWHNIDEIPIKGEVIIVQTKDNFYGLSIQKGGTTYKNKNKDRYVRWAYASDLLKLSNVQRTVKDCKEPVSIWHDASHQPTMYRKYLVRYSDGRVSGSWERHDDGFIPWKDVVKEHGFTHWCYTEDLIKL